MEKIQTLEISTENPIPGMNAIFFPQLLVGGSEVPSEGTLLFQMEDEKGVTYTTEKVILASTENQELTIISQYLEVIRRALRGVEIRVEDNYRHRYFCGQIDGEARYFLLDDAVIGEVNIQRGALQKMFSSFPELESLCDRLSVIQISSGEGKTHVIPDHHSSAVLNAVLVPRNGKYYTPTPQRFRFLRVTEEINDADECVIAAPHENELKRLMPDAEIFQLPDDHKENVSLLLPEDVHLYMLQQVRLKTGYIVRKYFEEVVQHETERALKDFMERL